MERQELRVKTCEQLEVEENLYDKYNVECETLKRFGGAK